MKRIEFFFDYLSPYSYLAWTRLREDLDIIKEHGELVLTPVILSQVIHAHETKGPAEIASKRDFLMKDCLRKAARAQVPFKVPKALPFNSLDALRLSQRSCSADRQISFIDACFRYAWEQGEDLGDDEPFSLYCENLGYAHNSMLEKVSMKELRRELKGQVKRAFDLGLFGVPSFLVFSDASSDNSEDTFELFWGHDAFDDLIAFLQGRDDLDQDEYQDYLRRF